ncbi:hypothetical protein QCA50_008448 [Cerrena zonata]|uniref:Uncharacterized protein n=1 Tax=Cerrena zonata TaxID=2478898 RepID=A0AAW0G418_9APHY
MSSDTEPWKRLCSERKQRQLDSIPKEWLIAVPSDPKLSVINVPRECGLLTTLELEITETVDVDILLGNLASGVWTSVQVTTAFYKRAIIAQQLTNCLTEIFIERALARAQDLR